LYIIPRLANYNIILGKPWIKKIRRIYRHEKKTITIKSTGIIINNKNSIRINKTILSEIIQISATSFNILAKRNKKWKYKVFAASIADIRKALAVKKKINPRTKLLERFHKYLFVFNYQTTDKPLFFRGKKIDHIIELEEVNGKKPIIL
jgi:hypothetical protein